MLSANDQRNRTVSTSIYLITKHSDYSTGSTYINMHLYTLRKWDHYELVVCVRACVCLRVC